MCFFMEEPINRGGPLLLLFVRVRQEKVTWDLEDQRVDSFLVQSFRRQGLEVYTMLFWFKFQY